MRIIGLFTLIFSIFILLATCVVFGFYEQIQQTGFEPGPVLCITMMLSLAGAIVGSMMLVGIFDDL